MKERPRRNDGSKNKIKNIKCMLNIDKRINFH